MLMEKLANDIAQVALNKLQVKTAADKQQGLTPLGKSLAAGEGATNAFLNNAPASTLAQNAAMAAGGVGPAVAYRANTRGIYSAPYTDPYFAYQRARAAKMQSLLHHSVGTEGSYSAPIDSNRVYNLPSSIGGTSRDYEFMHDLNGGDLRAGSRGMTLDHAIQNLTAKSMAEQQAQPVR